MSLLAGEIIAMIVICSSAPDLSASPAYVESIFFTSRLYKCPTNDSIVALPNIASPSVAGMAAVSDGSQLLDWGRIRFQ